MTDKTTQTTLDRARSFLLRYLPADGSPVLSADAHAAAEAEDIRPRTLQRAAKAIGVDVSSKPGPSGRTTTWALSADSTPTEPEPAEPEPPPTDQTVPTTRRGQLGQRAKFILGEPLPRTKGNQHR